jgi:hypothetical protein
MIQFFDAMALNISAVQRRGLFYDVLLVALVR